MAKRDIWEELRKSEQGKLLKEWVLQKMEETKLLPLTAQGTAEDIGKITMMSRGAYVLLTEMLQLLTIEDEGDKKKKDKSPSDYE